jgi:membrane fusion protein (multidrug efflux system)
MKKQIITVAIGIAIVFVAFGAMGYLSGQREEPEMKAPPQIKKYVETKPVSYSDIDTEVISYGRVRTAESIELISEVSGRMQQGSVRLKAGQKFKKGTLLYTVDDDEAALTLKATKSTFLKDLAAILPDLKIDFNDNFKAWESYFNKLDIDKTFPALPETKSDKEKTFIATQGIYSSYYSIKSSEERLKKHRYYAPFDGSISEVAIQSGAFVNTGTRIGKIIRSGVHELQVAVETSDVAWIQEGSPAQVYSDETQQNWEGRITRISDFVNENTQTVDVFITIYPNGQKIFDGQFMRAAVPSRTVKDGMIIPRNVIYNGNEVFVLQDSLLSVQRVNIFRTDQEIAIVNGLKEGSDLVIEPLINAHNDMKVFKRESKDINLETKNGDDTKLSESKEKVTAVSN